MESERTSQKRACFVVMPFSGRTLNPQGIAPWDEIYRDHIKPTVESAGLGCFRADEIVRPGSVIADVVEAVASSFLVVAEMTGQNPNVFYELGVRHALSRRTILLAQSVDDIPFDLRDFRTIVYSFTPRGARHLETALLEAINQVVDDPDHTDNPVQAFLSHQAGRELSDGMAPEAALVVQETLATLRRQNADLAAVVQDLKKMLGSSGIESATRDLVGTWTDEFLGLHEKKYVAAHDDRLLMAYGGQWPGCAIGIFDGQVYRFEWSRFDLTLGGSGVLRLVSPTRLEGGLWFGRDRLEDAPLERHVLSRLSLEVQPPGADLLRMARGFNGWPAREHEGSDS
jgi:hypothetical protein